MIADVTWAAGLGAVGAIATPIVVTVFGFLISKRLKAIEAKQWRNQELISARLGYYREIEEPLNDIYCYFSYIGTWKDPTPPEIIETKRSLDRTFHTLSPFFSPAVVQAYNRFMQLCFQTHGGWGVDAKLKTSFKRRRQCFPNGWLDEWDAMFIYSSDVPTPKDVIRGIKDAYNDTLAYLVSDIQITNARTDYSTVREVLSS